MSPQPAVETISRLCLSCGMCCNGVMFQLVRLQPTDSPKALAALGMPLKRKKKQHHFIQPCPCLEGAACTIYSARPERCRVFECRQIGALRSGDLTEADVAAAIQDIQAHVSRIESLLSAAGNTKTKQSLTDRYTRVMALPADPEHHAPTLALQQQIESEMQALNNLLNASFRLTPISLPLHQNSTFYPQNIPIPTPSSLTP